MENRKSENRESFASNLERERHFKIESVRKAIPMLRALHDLFEDGRMTDPEIAKLVAGSFTVSGVEVFSYFAKKLEEAKEKQIQEKRASKDK